jgi:hypothetical protein
MCVLRAQTRRSAAASALRACLAAAGVYLAGLPSGHAADAGAKRSAQAGSTGAGGTSQGAAPTEGPAATPAEQAPAAAEQSPAQPPTQETAGSQPPTPQPVAAPSDPPFLVPDHAIAPPPPPALSYPLSYRGPLRPEEQPEEQPTEGSSGSSTPTRVETADGVTLLSNRIVTRSSAAPAAAPIPGTEANAPEVPETEEAEEDPDGLAAFINFGSSAARERARARREPGDSGGGLGWVWLAVGLLPLLLVPIALLLNRGARRGAQPSHAPGHTSLEPGPPPSAGPPLSAAPRSPRSRR